MALTRERTVNDGGARRIALSASIALNLFFVAVIGGYLLRPTFLARPSGGPMGRAVAAVESQLDDADATAFEAIVQRDKPRNAEAERALVASRDALETDLASEPFNPAKAKVAVANTREALDHIIDSFSATVIDALNHLSPAGRKKLVELRRERLEAFDPSKSP